MKKSLENNNNNNNLDFITKFKNLWKPHDFIRSKKWDGVYWPDEEGTWKNHMTEKTIMWPEIFVFCCCIGCWGLHIINKQQLVEFEMRNEVLGRREGTELGFSESKEKWEIRVLWKIRWREVLRHYRKSSIPFCE